MDQQQSAENQSRPLDKVRRMRMARRLWRAQTVYLITLAAFGVLAVFARAYAYFGWDETAATELQHLSIPGISIFMTDISVFGNGWIPFVVTALTVLAFLVFRKRSEAAALALSAGGGELVNRIIKLLIGRPRPSPALVQVLVSPGSESFPSGHVTFYVCYFGFLFFAAYALLPRGSNLRRLALALSALPVLTVGLSRVYLGAHWPSDALGAYLFGGLWLALSLDIYRRWKRNATLHPELK